MPIKRYIFVIFLTVSYLINTVLVSFEDLGLFYLLRRMQETLQLWTVFERLQSLKNFRLSVNWRFSSLKNVNQFHILCHGLKKTRNITKWRKQNFEHGAFVLGPSFEIALGLVATPPDQNPHRRGWTGEKSTHTKRYLQGYPGETSKLFPKKWRENHRLSV